ncbi:MAG: acetyltransferase [Hydrogenovibrio sp.]|uniref:acetyltransferase n=1 Tax=Hydrogenovibrio sp. TaxID=2065821 RepID=UPI0028701ACE|nr:acetyltransferase [Hydrogenovibrio sp.]MDR9499363.1 acetyltransferase [Hydrogenovibrio sp.]
MKQLLLLGAGGHCRSCIDVLEQTNDWHIAGIVDRIDASMTEVSGYPVIGSDEDLPDLRKTYESALVTVGQTASAEHRVRLFNLLNQLGFIQPGLVSPQAYVSPHARIGAGSVVMHQALVNTGASIGRNAIVNSKALVEHDAVIGDHTHVATGAIVNGDVQIGHGCLIGSGAMIKQGVQIANNVIIGAGARIIRDIASPGCYVDMGRELNQVEGL